ncbi:MAG: DUF1799 domain-containing protein [Paracoccaceae bacterium]|nr:MAG: DUF1799 domain-containing protein [Paracoccaceae bacterium]
MARPPAGLSACADGAAAGLPGGHGEARPGKLRDFGRRWARGALGGGGARDEADDDARRFGLEPPPRPPAFGLWPRHAAPARAFLAVCTQWRLAPGGVVIGLDYAAALAALAAEGIEVTPEVWRDLRAIEAGAIKGFGEAK